MKLRSGIPASEQRFFGQTGWPRDLAGELILEVGSGSGRFTEQAARTGATVVSFDYSYAVDANYASNGALGNVLIVQADVFAMPFRPQSFDRLFCFGMLQHTPSPPRAFAALPGVLKPGGSLCADIYKVSFWRTIGQTKYWVRPFTRRMHPDRLYARVRRWVDFMWPLANVIRRLPKGYAINWRLLVADYSFLGLQGQMLKEWSYLDTFDMLAPRYDRPATKETFCQWAKDAGLIDIDAYYSPARRCAWHARAGLEGRTRSLDVRHRGSAGRFSGRPAEEDDRQRGAPGPRRRGCAVDRHGKRVANRPRPSAARHH